jgi:hypothetical protein
MKQETYDMVKEAINRLNGWSKILVVIIPILIGGLIGYGKLQSEVSNKVDKERVAILETTVGRNTEIIKELKSALEKNNEQHTLIITTLTEVKTLVKRNK